MTEPNTKHFAPAGMSYSLALGLGARNLSSGDAPPDDAHFVTDDAGVYVTDDVGTQVVDT